MKIYIALGLLAWAGLVFGHGHGGTSYANTNSKAIASGHGGEEGGHYNYYHHPEYKFEYGVEDHKTGDKKSQWEHRDGDVVKGGYTVDHPHGKKHALEFVVRSKHSEKW